MLRFNFLLQTILQIFDKQIRELSTYDETFEIFLPTFQFNHLDSEWELKNEQNKIMLDLKNEKNVNLNMQLIVITLGCNKTDNINER